MTIHDQFSADLIGIAPHVRAFARMLCSGNRAEAEDLAQEGLIKAWRAQSSFTPGTNLKAWCFMIVRNQFYSDKRRSWRMQPLDPETAEQTLVATSNPMDALELDELRRALTILPDSQREALILIAAGGLSYEDAAEIVGAAVGTIKSRVSRARDSLARVYAEGELPRDGELPSAAMASILKEASDLTKRLAA